MAHLSCTGWVYRGVPIVDRRGADNITLVRVKCHLKLSGEVKQKILERM